MNMRSGTCSEDVRDQGSSSGKSAVHQPIALWSGPINTFLHTRAPKDEVILNPSISMLASCAIYCCWLLLLSSSCSKPVSSTEGPFTSRYFSNGFYDIQASQHIISTHHAEEKNREQQLHFSGVFSPWKSALLHCIEKRRFLIWQ